MLMLLVIVATGCGGGGGSINNNLPEYIDELGVYEEGYDGVVVYFILADEYGAMTAFDGTVKLTIIEDYTLLYYDSRDVKECDFYATTAGVGAFEHDVIVYSFGRIPYSQFNGPPISKGEVKIKYIFREEGAGIGSVLEVAESYYF